MNDLDEEVMATVLANEKTARMFIEHLEARGVTFSIDTKVMTHEQCIDAVLAVGRELAMRELK